MAGLSNSNQTGTAGAAGDLICRPVLHGEVEPALRLILATPAGLGSDAQVLDFLSFCVERKIDTTAIWIAVHRNTLVWALLPVVSPGKTMMLFTPAAALRETPAGAPGTLASAVCSHWALRGVTLAQMLIDPQARPVIDTYRAAGFDELAELVYLQKQVRARRIPIPNFAPNFTLKTYSSETHNAFADIIQRSYHDSLDCPALNGLRDMNDVITGHQSTGEYDPAMWWILCRGDHTLAVLLLSRVPQQSAIELVYLGLAPEARGQGIGDLLMQHAIATVAMDK